MASLRYFVIICFLVVTATFILLILNGRSFIETRIIRAIVEDNNLSIGESFTHSIWRRYPKTLASIPCTGKKCPSQKTLDRLTKDIDSFFEDLPVLAYEVYSSDGKLLFSRYSKTNKDLDAEEGGLERFKTAKQGKASSDIIFDFQLGSGRPRNVVRSFIPIIPDISSSKATRERVPGVLKLVYDITPFWGDPMGVQIILIALTVLIIALMVGAMYYYVYQTEQLLTKQYETNIDLISAKTSAEEENREKSMFLANVSHELRTPLNAIIGFSEIIKDEVMGPLNNPQYKEYIKDINISGVHLLSLINDILDYSKAEAGKLTVDMADVDITKILKNSVRLVSPRAVEAGVELIDQIPKEHHILCTDGKRLKQVTLNLLSNAVKFTPQSGSVTLYAWSNITDNSFVIEVQDTGVGIAPKDISKVMATFGQVENKLSRKYEGTGLGLPLSKKLVELMGGELGIESELSKGTTVTITLPYVAGEHTQKKKPSSRETAASQKTTQETPPVNEPVQTEETPSIT